MVTPKTYNIFRGKHRYYRYIINRPEENQIYFLDQSTLDVIISCNYILGEHVYEPRPYKFYWAHSIYWTVNKLAKKNKKDTKQVLIYVLKYIVTPIAVACITYFLLGK